MYDGAVQDLADGFQRAAIAGDWETPLKALAGACGGTAAQLIGVGARGAVPFNIAYGIDPEALDEFVRRDGGNPARNPRVRFGVAGAPLSVMTEADFGPIERTLKTELYEELFTPHDITFSLQTKLLGGATGVIGLAVLKSERRGIATVEEKRLFAAVAPSIQAAVRTRLALEADGARLVAGGFQAADIAAFICNASGVVAALTPAAEGLALDGAHLRIVRGRLVATSPADGDRLQAAIWCNGHRDGPAAPELRQVMLRCPSEGTALLVEVAPLPARDFPLALEAAVLVIARAPRALARLSPLLQQAYGLTRAESEVCLAVAGGQPLPDIARARQVSEQTIRAQVKHAAGKLGLRRQAEIAAFVNAL